MWPWEKQYTTRSPVVVWKTLRWRLADACLSASLWFDEEACVMHKDIRATIEYYKSGEVMTLRRQMKPTDDE